MFKKKQLLCIPISRYFLRGYFAYLDTKLLGKSKVFGHLVPQKVQILWYDDHKLTSKVPKRRRKKKDNDEEERDEGEEVKKKINKKKNKGGGKGEERGGEGGREGGGG